MEVEEQEAAAYYPLYILLFFLTFPLEGPSSYFLRVVSFLLVLVLDLR